MKQQGRCIVGDPTRVEGYTSGWMSVKVHPGTFYRREDAILESLDTIKGYYAQLDMGQFILLRFSDKDDVTKFHRLHHEYL